MELLEDLGMPVEHIVLTTHAYEHKIFVPPFQRCYGTAQVWVVPRRAVGARVCSSEPMCLGNTHAEVPYQSPHMPPPRASASIAAAWALLDTQCCCRLCPFGLYCNACMHGNPILWP